MPSRSAAPGRPARATVRDLYAIVRAAAHYADLFDAAATDLAA
jgi:hypothetical protein